MRIEEVDLGDAPQFHEWNETVEGVWQEAWPGDPRWADEAQLRELFADREENARLLFVAHTPSGEVAGAAEVRLPMKDNLHLASIEVSVPSSHRGAGYGRALLERAQACASANGRTTHVSNTYGRLASLDSRDARFAVAAGFSLARTEIRRELQLPVDDTVVKELEAESEAVAGDAYELVSWSGRCPDDLVESRARLAWTLTADEPRGDLNVEDEQFDAERIRRWERDLEKIGRVVAATGAVSAETGQLAAVTELGLPRVGENLAIQFATVVDRAHRGHRLGLLVKLANLRQVKEHPVATSRICTWNAESNQHMIRVNELLGFAIAGKGFNWQKAVA